jgi:hypothetical protein
MFLSSPRQISVQPKMTNDNLQKDASFLKGASSSEDSNKLIGVLPGCGKIGRIRRMWTVQKFWLYPVITLEEPKKFQILAQAVFNCDLDGKKQVESLQTQKLNVKTDNFTFRFTTPHQWKSHLNGMDIKNNALSYQRIRR